MIGSTYVCQSLARRGSTIFVALIFILIVAVSVGAILEYAMSEQRLTRRRIEREAVYYSAEAGIDQVVHWMVEPTHYTPNTSLFAVDSTTQTFRDSSNVSVFQSRLSGSGTPLIDVDNNLNPDMIVFTNEPINTGERARVTDLTVYPPTWDATAPAGTVIIVESTAENQFGVSRTVRSWITADPTFPDLDFPAAVVSHATGGANGQANVHWGEAWIQNDVSINNISNITTTADPWANFLIGGEIRNGNMTKWADGTPSWSNTPLDPSEPNYYQPWLGHDATHENLYQYTDFDADVFSLYDDISGWDDLALSYEQWRLLALDRGHFFSTDASGNLYYGTEETPENMLTVDEFSAIIDQSADLSVDPLDSSTQDLPPPSIVFIDTVDGNPPAADGSNFCDIRLTGSMGFTRGVFYVGGDLYIGGVGTPPAAWIQDPLWVQTNGASGSETLQNVRHMGIIYCDGVYAQQGNQITYGCIAARNGFGTGGTPDVWYDERLKNGIPFPFDPGVTVARWAEVSGPMIN